MFVYDLIVYCVFLFVFDDDAFSFASSFAFRRVRNIFSVFLNVYIMCLCFGCIVSCCGVFLFVCVYVLVFVSVVLCGLCLYDVIKI